MDIFSDSDESFTWTKVSNASSISDIESMSPVKIQNGHNDSPKKNKLNIHSEAMAEHITDAVRAKKRKIKQSTGTDSEGCDSPKKRRVINDEYLEGNVSNKKKMKEKITFENSNDLDYLDIKVKSEELSTSETSYSKSKKKKRKKHNEPEDFDEKYLNLHVKQEQSNDLNPTLDDSVKRKKNKHKKSEVRNRTEDTNEHSLTTRVKDEPILTDSTPEKFKTKKKSKVSVSSNFENQPDAEHIDEDYYINIKVEEEDPFAKPKSKKKKRDSQSSTNINQMFDNVSVESIETTPKKKKSRKSECVDINSESDSTPKSKKNNHQELTDNDKLMFSSEKDVEKDKTSGSSHVKSKGLIEKQHTLIKLNNKKSSYSSDTVDNYRPLEDSENRDKKADRRLNRHTTSNDDIPADKTNKISINKSTKLKSQARNNISNDRDDSSSDSDNTIENKQKSVHVQKETRSPRRTISKGDCISDQSSSAENKNKSPTSRKNISKEIVSEDSSSDNSKPNKNSLRASRGDSISDQSSSVKKKVKSLEPASISSQASKKLSISSKRSVSNSSSSSDENNSIVNGGNCLKHKSKQLNKNTPRTFSQNYDSSGDSNSDQDKSTKLTKSPQVRKQSISNLSRRTISKRSSTDEDRTDTVQIKSVSKSPKKNSSSILRAVSKSDDSSDESVTSQSESVQVQSKKVAGRRITDRIRFEHDDSDETDQSKLNLSSSKLKYYQETNSNLSPIINKPRSNSVITDDDEIWILKCPCDINVGNLKDCEFVLDKKCKFKMNGETYHGAVQNDLEKIAITSFEEKGFVIKNLPLNGVIHVKKRIPKQHVQDDSMLMQSQNQFIPLPETKCRHPFFGADYKKAIKIPKRIAQNLKADQTEELPSPEQDRRERKKNRKRLRESLKEEPQEEFEETVPEKKKKAKKRKHDDSDEVPTKKAKKKKHVSSEVWDSEKAIEENLFNY